MRFQTVVISRATGAAKSKAMHFAVNTSLALWSAYKPPLHFSLDSSWSGNAGVAVRQSAMIPVQEPAVKWGGTLATALRNVTCAFPARNTVRLLGSSA